MRLKNAFLKSILASAAVGFLLLLIPTPRLVKQTPDANPVNRTIWIASQLTDNTYDQLIRDWLLTLVFTGKEEFAYDFARNTTAGLARTQAFIHIADALMANSKSDESQRALQFALQSVGSINIEDEKFSAYALVVARKGETNEAFKQSRQINDQSVLADTLSSLVFYFINAGNFEAAAKVAHIESIPWRKPQLLFQLAKALFETNQYEHGKAIAREAFELALQLPGGGDDVLESFAPVIVEAGLMGELLRAFQMLEKRDIYVSDQAFEAIAVGFAKLGNLDQAIAIAHDISKEAPANLYLNDGRARALASVSQIWRESGRTHQADVVLTEALNTALQIEFPPHRSWALHKIAPLLVKAHRQEEALSAVRTIDIGDNEPLAFTAVALAEMGRWDESDQATMEAFNSASNFEHVIIRSGALIALVKANLKANRVGEARNFVELARQKLPKIEDPLFKSDAYQIIAESFAKLGDWEQANAMAALCDQPTDKLAACIAIVREHSIKSVPALANKFMEIEPQ